MVDPGPSARRLEASVHVHSGGGGYLRLFSRNSVNGSSATPLCASISAVVVVASGRVPNGALWRLEIEGDALDLVTMARVTDLNGHRYGGGAGGPACYPDRRLNAAVGHDPDATTAYWIGRVTEDVSAVVVTMSDGTREDLNLYGDPGHHGARVAVLIYPRHLDIHRVDLFDRHGDLLPDERS